MLVDGERDSIDAGTGSDGSNSDSTLVPLLSGILAGVVFLAFL